MATRPRNILQLSSALTNDLLNPGANKVYGTDANGVKGWKDDPSGGGGSLDFLGLTDTPDTYSAQGGKYLVVKSDDSGIEFVTAPFWKTAGTTTLTGDVSVDTQGHNVTFYGNGANTLIFGDSNPGTGFSVFNLSVEQAANWRAGTFASGNYTDVQYAGGVTPYLQISSRNTTTSRYMHMINGSGTGEYFGFSIRYGNPASSLATVALGITPAGVWTANFGSDAIGDMYQRNSSGNLSRLASVATGNVLISGGVGTVNSWGKVGLTTHVSGTLPATNGGTGLSALGSAGQVLKVNSGGSALEYGTFGSNTQVIYNSGGVLQGSTSFTFDGSTVNAKSLALTGFNNSIILDVMDDSSFSILTIAESGGSPRVELNLGSDNTGDIYCRNSSGNLSKLAIGTEGQVLTVSSAGIPEWAESTLFTIEDVSTTTYNFVEGDKGKIKRFTNASGCTATIPTGLSTGWNTVAYRADGAGILTLASAGTIEGVGTTLETDSTACTVVHRGSDVHVLLGALGSGGGGGITNSANTGEVAISNGTNIIGDSLFKWDSTGKALVIASGTPPGSSVTDGFQLYSADITAGNAAPHFRSEAGHIIKLYQVNNGSAYSVSNGTTDRTFDANSTTMDELADVLATLIADLKLTGILA